jgi:hypothetical protein
MVLPFRPSTRKVAKSSIHQLRNCSSPCSPFP